MADSASARQALDHIALGEMVADEAEAALGMEALAVEGDDAGGLLAAVLERVQPQRGNGRGIAIADNAEDAAFFPQMVRVVEGSILEGFMCHGGLHPRNGGRLGTPGSAGTPPPEDAPQVNWSMAWAGCRPRVSCPALRPV